MEITDETVVSVARRLLGSGKTGGTESVSLQHWVLQFRVASTESWKIVGEFGDWMVNGRPIWVAYRALVLGCLIVLNKSPGIRPVVLGETWQRILEKCVLELTGAKRPEGWSNSAGGWRLGLKVGFTGCGYCSSRTPRRSTRGFSPLERAMHSMRRTAHL